MKLVILDGISKIRHRPYSKEFLLWARSYQSSSRKVKMQRVKLVHCVTPQSKDVRDTARLSIVYED